MKMKESIKKMMMTKKQMAKKQKQMQSLANKPAKKGK